MFPENEQDIAHRQKPGFGVHDETKACVRALLVDSGGEICKRVIEVAMDLRQPAERRAFGRRRWSQEAEVGFRVWASEISPSVLSLVVKELSLAEVPGFRDARMASRNSWQLDVGIRAECTSPPWLCPMSSLRTSAITSASTRRELNVWRRSWKR